MKKFMFLAAFCVLSSSVAFVSVQAEDGGAGVSYSKKKQGMVHFVDEAAQDEATAAAQDASSDASNPADIEPAAGVEQEPAADDNIAAEMIKLPRK